jgi:putative ABC transport system substrate-binding protein
MIERREFITLIGGAAAPSILWPLAARAQQRDQMRRIGVLMSSADVGPDAHPGLAAFRQALQKLGWTEGRNVRIDYRWAVADADHALANAVELVGLKPDVLLAASSLPLQALQRETRTIPIVFAQINDPVGSGFVASLARPGGNITGFTPAEFSMGGKLLEVLREVAPSVTQVAILLPAELAPQVGMLRAIEAVAPALGVQATSADVHDAAEIERAIGAFARNSNGGLIVLSSPATNVHRELIVALAARHRLPAVYPYRYFVAEGGLISYGIDDLSDLWRRAASYVDRILKGEKAGDLPVQQPTKFELVINLKTAKALGLTIPPGVLARADEVIE